MKPRFAYLLVALALVAAAAAAFVWLRRPAEVQGARTTIGRAVEVVYATGFVEPRQPVEAAARVTAPIAEVLAEEGQRVARGQPLVRLEDDEQRQAIAQLAAQTANAEFEERRTLALFNRGFASAAARDRVVTAASAARAAEAVARARLDQFVLRAGIAGVVLRRDAEPGDLATPNRVLFVLGDPALVRITATVDERDIPRVLPGQRALMSSDAFAGKVYGGTVHDITPGGDPEQRAFRVRIWPDAASALPVGLTLEVNVVTREHAGALLVPADAVRDGAVWTARDGRAVRAQVRTGIAGGEKIEVVGGLARGACVLVDPPEALEEGDRLAVKGC
jgi:RND family efflux transporter MFP subunit